MKRIICTILLFCLWTGILGCGNAMDDAITFYYCRNPEEFRFFSEDSVIAPEKRNLTGHRNDVPYLLRLYLAGPLEEDLHSPFPRNTHLIQAAQLQDTVEIDLSDLDGSMSDSAFSLACACLTKTCIPYFGCSKVTVRSGSRSITMTSESIVLSDTIPQETTTGGQS